MTIRVWYGQSSSSHPTGVRGLKFDGILRGTTSPSRSHPTGVRGLKYRQGHRPCFRNPSHPTGVRGLKFLSLRVIVLPATVAPHWGAWIEINGLQS